MIIYPFDNSHRVFQLRGMLMLRSETIVDADENCASLFGKFSTQEILGVKVTENVSAAMREDPERQRARCRTGLRCINAISNTLGVAICHYYRVRGS